MRQLFLDFDHPLERDELEKSIDAVADMAQVHLRLRECYPTARGFHCVVDAISHKPAEWVKCPTWDDHCNCTPLFACQQARELTPMEVVALQLLCGSDANREAYNFQRARVLGDVPAFWQNRWNVLYQEKL